MPQKIKVTQPKSAIAQAVLIKNKNKKRLKGSKRKGLKKFAAPGKSQLSVDKINLDPEFAQGLLDNTPKQQRNLRPSLVDRYASDMLAGRWRTTGDPIRLTPNLELADGQHRCAAVVKSGATIPDVLIAVLQDKKAFDSIDQGARRSLTDVLRMNGSIPVPTTVQAGIVFESLDFKPRNISMAEKLQIVMACPYTETLKHFAHTSNKVATAGMLAAALRCLKINDEDALEFFNAVFSNTHLVHGKFNRNAHLLATWAYKCKNDPRVRKTAEGWKRESAARFILAWNAFRSSKELFRLVYAVKSPFPDAI